MFWITAQPFELDEFEKKLKKSQKENVQKNKCPNISTQIVN